MANEAFSVHDSPDEPLVGKEQPNEDTARWESVSVAYGVLSVVSKTMLEYGFLVLLDVLPTVQN